MSSKCKSIRFVIVWFIQSRKVSDVVRFREQGPAGTAGILSGVTNYDRTTTEYKNTGIKKKILDFKLHGAALKWAIKNSQLLSGIYFLKFTYNAQFIKYILNCTFCNENSD